MIYGKVNKNYSELIKNILSLLKKPGRKHVPENPLLHSHLDYYQTNVDEH